MPIITFNPGNITIHADPGTLLVDAARAAGLTADVPCGGRGVCGKCLARVEAGSVDFTDNGVMPAGMASDGWVLLCRARVAEGPATVALSDGLASERGQFLMAGQDRMLVDPALLPEPEDIDPLVKTDEMAVPAPAAGDGLSDADRLERALLSKTGTARMELPLGVLHALPEALRANEGNVQANYSFADGITKIVSVRAASAAPRYGVAVDVGTTTVAVQLVNLVDGGILAEKTAYNAQISCGLDVISRINWAKRTGGLEELSSNVLDTVNGLVTDLSQSIGVEPNDVLAASIAGNTTMTHMLLGIPPEYIRLEPYTPAVYTVPELRAREVGLAIHPEAAVRFAPAVGSYVGGDITSGLLCTSLATGSEDIVLFIDIGTNGEIVLGNSEFLLGCACSAGPAFEGGGLDCGMRASAGAVEWADVDKATGMPGLSVIGGGKPAGICGSGMISLLANLFESGWLDAAGRLDRTRPCAAIEPMGRGARYVLARAGQTATGRDMYVSEADIGNVIRAKAAIFSACRVLLNKVGLGFQDLSAMVIAGGFGRYLDIQKAKAIGLIPNLPEGKFRFLGNASLTGAQMTLVSERHRRKQHELASRITYIDLSLEPDYMDEYTAALFLPHTDIKLFY